MALPVETLRRPSFILLILNFFFSLIVFACIIDKCKPSSYCVYNDSHACNFAIGLGVFTFLLTLVFMAAELFQDTLGAMRRTIALAEMFLSGLLAFLWCVSACINCPLCPLSILSLGAHLCIDRTLAELQIDDHSTRHRE